MTHGNMNVKAGGTHSDIVEDIIFLCFTPYRLVSCYRRSGNS